MLGDNVKLGVDIVLLVVRKVHVLEVRLDLLGVLVELEHVVFSSAELETTADNLHKADYRSTD